MKCLKISENPKERVSPTTDPPNGPQLPNYDEYEHQAAVINYILRNFNDNKPKQATAST
jgi:hypothetical protein